MRRTAIDPHMLNLSGLSLNGVGVLILVFCPPPVPAREIMEDGREKYPQTAVREWAPPDGSKVGRLKYRVRRYGFRTGVALLALGFLLQIIATLGR